MGCVIATGTIDPVASMSAVAVSPVVAAGVPADLTFDADVAPGRLVRVRSHRLHLYCVGEGDPIIILEAGLGGFSLEWLDVQRMLAAQHRVCSYDRAGYGWSDPGPAPRTVDHLTAELHTLLDEAGESPPYLLVGHSFGGYVVQLFAKRYPSLTTGLVLVESSHPLQFGRFPGAQRRLYELAGRRRSSWGSGVPALPANYPAEVRELAQQLMQQPKTLRAFRLEYRSFPNSGMQVAEAGAMPDLPSVVLTRSARQWPHTSDGDAMEALWPELQGELADALPRARHFTIANSGHHLHLDQPDAIEEAVDLVIEQQDRAAMVEPHDAVGAGAR